MDRKLEISQAGYAEIVGSKDGRNVHWTTEKNVEMPIKMRNDGPEEGRMKPVTIVDVFLSTVDKFKDEHSMSVEREGKTLSWTWGDYYD